MVSEDLEFCVFYSCLFADIYWKNEHRLMCTSDICTATERDRYEKSVSLSFFFFLKLEMEFVKCFLCSLMVESG